MEFQISGVLTPYYCLLSLVLQTIEAVVTPPTTSTFCGPRRVWFTAFGVPRYLPGFSRHRHIVVNLHPLSNDAAWLAGTFRYASPLAI